MAKMIHYVDLRTVSLVCPRLPCKAFLMEKLVVLHLLQMENETEEKKSPLPSWIQAHIS